MAKKAIISHLKGDIKTFKREAAEDRELISKLKKPSRKKRKMKEVMHEFKEGELHSGSRRGPVVKNPKQAIAIAFSEARRAARKKKKKK